MLPPPTRVLVVDDDAQLLRALARLLRRHEAHLVAARSASEAVAVLRASDVLPDLILTELDLPDAGGEELLRVVRADEVLAEIPVVAMSASPTEEAFDLHLEKPFSLSALRAALDLARAGERRESDEGGARDAVEDLLRPVDRGPGPARPLPPAGLARMVDAVLAATRAGSRA